MANEQNLKPWPKGTSGNPDGSSKRQRLTNALVAMMEEDGVSRAFVRVGLDAAKAGDFRFWSYIFDRIDGKAKDAQGDGDHSGDANPEELSPELKRAIEAYGYRLPGAGMGGAESGPLRDSGERGTVEDDPPPEPAE